jgi:ABC-type transport system involved in cytochrome c biogenesis permease subunit
MKSKLVYGLLLLAAWLVAANVAVILLVLPDEAAQGAIYRIIFFHVPAAWTAFVGFFAAFVSSAAMWRLLYGVRRMHAVIGVENRALRLHHSRPFYL